MKRILASHIVTPIGSGRLPGRVKNGGALFMPCWASKIAHKNARKAQKHAKNGGSQNFGANVCLVFSAAKNVFFEPVRSDICLWLDVPSVTFFHPRCHACNVAFGY